MLRKDELLKDVSMMRRGPTTLNSARSAVQQLSIRSWPVTVKSIGMCCLGRDRSMRVGIRDDPTSKSSIRGCPLYAKSSLGFAQGGIGFGLIAHSDTSKHGISACPGSL